VNNVPWERSGGRGRRVVSDTEQGGVSDVNEPVEDEHPVRNGPPMGGAPVAGAPVVVGESVGGKRHCWGHL
jgi:hypothetical protein